MQLPAFSLLLTVVVTVQALVTLETIRTLTNVTNECRGRVTGKEMSADAELDPMVAVLGGGGGPGQVILGGGDDVEAVEEVSGFFLL